MGPRIARQASPRIARHESPDRAAWVPGSRGMGPRIARQRVPGSRSDAVPGARGTGHPDRAVWVPGSREMGPRIARHGPRIARNGSPVARHGRIAWHGSPIARMRPRIGRDGCSILSSVVGTGERDVDHGRGERGANIDHGRRGRESNSASKVFDRGESTRAGTAETLGGARIERPRAGPCGAFAVDLRLLSVLGLRLQRLDEHLPRRLAGG